MRRHPLAPHEASAAATKVYRALIEGGALPSFIVAEGTAPFTIPTNKLLLLCN
jgi:hypothetical protein